MKRNALKTILSTTLTSVLISASILSAVPKPVLAATFDAKITPDSQVITEGETAMFNISFSLEGVTPGPGTYGTEVTFGDGTSTGCILRAPGTYPISHTYSKSTLDVYTVKFAVSNACLSINQAKGQNPVYAYVSVSNNTPTVSITPDSPTVYQNTALTFTANVQNGNPAYTYAWSGSCGGTGTTSSAATSAVGAFSCTVTVTDSDGDTATDSVNYTVKAKSTDPVNPPADDEEDQDESDQPEETGEVLGMESCAVEDKTRISGYAYYDENDNQFKDAEEKGLKDVDIKIYSIKETQATLVTRISTDEFGYWKADVCAGNIKIKLDENTLPDNTELLGEGQIEVTAEKGKALNDQNFALVKPAEEIEEKGFNWLWAIIPVTLVGALTGIIIWARKKKVENEEVVRAI